MINMVKKYKLKICLLTFNLM